MQRIIFLVIPFVVLSCSSDVEDSRSKSPQVQNAELKPIDELKLSQQTLGVYEESEVAMCVQEAQAFGLVDDRCTECDSANFTSRHEVCHGKFSSPQKEAECLRKACDAVVKEYETKYPKGHPKCPTTNGTCTGLLDGNYTEGTCAYDDFYVFEGRDGITGSTNPTLDPLLKGVSCEIFRYDDHYAVRYGLTCKYTCDTTKPPTKPEPTNNLHCDLPGYQVVGQGAYARCVRIIE